MAGCPGGGGGGGLGTALGPIGAVIATGGLPFLTGGVAVNPVIVAAMIILMILIPITLDELQHGPRPTLKRLKYEQYRGLSYKCKRVLNYYRRTSVGDYNRAIEYIRSNPAQAKETLEEMHQHLLEGHADY